MRLIPIPIVPIFYLIHLTNSESLASSISRLLNGIAAPNALKRIARKEWLPSSNFRTEILKQTVAQDFNKITKSINSADEQKSNKSTDGEGVNGALSKKIEGMFKQKPGHSSIEKISHPGLASIQQPDRTSPFLKNDKTAANLMIRRINSWLWKTISPKL